MIAANQNFTITQGETLVSQITVQIPGTPVTINGSSTLGSNVLTIPDTTQVSLGWTVTGTGVPTNSIITVISSPTTVAISFPMPSTGTNTPFVFGAYAPVNLTGVQLLFSAKAIIAPNSTTQSQAYSLPDNDTIAQGVYEFNWTESFSANLGQTILNIPETVTQQMAPGNWYYLVRAIGAPGLAHSSNILTGIINIVQPPSLRIV